MTVATPPARLQATVRSFQFFTLSFGVIVGVGWITILGAWLSQAGPVGTAVGLLGGGGLMIVIGLCYAEMATLVPASGGEPAFAFEAFGPALFFAVGWLLALSFIAAGAFEAISLGWVVGALLPGIEGPPLYSMLGAPVQAGTVALAFAGTLLLAWLNVRGVGVAARAQEILIIAFLGMAALFIGTGILRGDADNLRPFIVADASGSEWGGVIAIFMTGSFWFAGFSVVPQMMEERAPATPLRRVGQMIVWSIVAGVAFKVLVVISASMTMPWRELVNLPLPTAAAFERAFGSRLLSGIVLFTGLVGLLSALNSVIISASRILFSLGRSRMIVAGFSGVDPRSGAPTLAIGTATVLMLVGVLAGKKAVIPIVNVSSTGLAFAFLITCLAVIRLRRRDPSRERPYRVPGGVATAYVGVAGSVLSLGLSIYQPYKDAGNTPPIEWIVVAAWAALGALFWKLGEARRRTVSAAELRAQIMPS